MEIREGFVECDPVALVLGRAQVDSRSLTPDQSMRIWKEVISECRPSLISLPGLRCLGGELLGSSSPIDGRTITPDDLIVFPPGLSYDTACLLLHHSGNTLSATNLYLTTDARVFLWQYLAQKTEVAVGEGESSRSVEVLKVVKSLITWLDDGALRAHFEEARSLDLMLASLVSCFDPNKFGRTAERELEWRIRPIRDRIRQTHRWLSGVKGRLA